MNRWTQIMERRVSFPELMCWQLVGATVGFGIFLFITGCATLPKEVDLAGGMFSGHVNWKNPQKQPPGEVLVRAHIPEGDAYTIVISRDNPSQSANIDLRDTGNRSRKFPEPSYGEVPPQPERE